MQVIATNNAHPDFLNLCRQLDAFLDQIAGGHANRKAYVPLNIIPDVSVVFLGYADKQAAGCAALKPLSSETAEVKRMFVHEAFRARGFARALMHKLETYAITQGFRELVLETGRPLVAATRLYHTLGYTAIDNYGPYIHMSASICMCKKL